MTSVVDSGARERILNAAYALFLSQGFKPTTTRQIAEAAEVNESTIFRVFTSKSKLFQAVLSHYVSERLTLDLSSAPTESDARRALAGLVERMVRLLMETVPAFRLLVKGSLMDAEILREVDKRFRALQHQLWQHLMGLRGRGILGERDYGPSVELVFGSIELQAFEFTVQEAWQGDASGAIEAYAARLADFMFERWGLESEGDR